MAELSINKSEEIVMKLLHYFITEEGYNPVVLHGAKDEIWLENLDKEYKIIRIVTNYIHNDEQLNFDLLRTNQIMNRIKKKTLSLKMTALSLFLNLGENVNYDVTLDNIKLANLKSMKDIKKYNFITEYFPNILKKTNFKEAGMDLFMKLTGEINAKGEKDAKVAENVFKMKRPTVTTVLIILNVFMFLLTYLFGNGSTDSQTLYNFGGLIKGSLSSGDYYRLLVSGFLHAGLIHLSFNMYALYVIGQQIESFYGKTKYVIIYLTSLVVGNLLSMLFLNNSLGVGASGAIFGLLGSLLYFGYHYRIYLGTVIKSQIIPIIILNLMLGFTIPGIDNAAHIGGLIGGFLVSVALGVKNRSKKNDMINGLVLLIMFIMFLIYMNYLQ